MIITNDNISFDIGVIEECTRELEDSIGDRKEFLDRLVVERLKRCNDLYLAEYQDSVNRMMKYIEMGAVSLRDIPRYMKRVNKNMKSLYSVESAIYKIL